MKLVLKQPITFEIKGKLAIWMLEHGWHKSFYIESISNGFLFLKDYHRTEGIENLDIWQEPEPDYNEWIGEVCVFSLGKLNSDNFRDWSTQVGILKDITKIGLDSKRVFMDSTGKLHENCMLKSDYVKLLKEQSK